MKVESGNPTGSMKDRMALAVVDRAAASGRLTSTGRLVEYTGGSTGTSLALVCAARRFAITVVTSDAFSLEKRNHMRALGAEVVEIPSDRGAITKDLIEAMMAKAAALRIAQRLGKGKTVVTLLCDSGLKYLSTDLYSGR